MPDYPLPRQKSKARLLKKMGHYSNSMINLQFDDFATKNKIFTVKTDRHVMYVKRTKIERV